MESQLIMQLVLRLLIIYLNTDSTYQPQNDFFVLNKNIEQICLLGDFKGADEIIVCDNQFYSKCRFKDKQKVVLMGQSQVLLYLDPQHFKVPDRLWIHPIQKGYPIHFRGYHMDMGFVYTRIHQLQ